MIKFNKADDKIAIIAPASGVNDVNGFIDLKQSMNRLDMMISLLQDNGFHCSYDREIFNKDTSKSLGYFASSRESRLSQLNNAISDPDIKIIWAFRGGYGSTEIVFDCLDKLPPHPSCKILIGFSDITALHFLFNQHYKLPCIHGAMDANQEGMIKQVISVLKGSTMKFDLTTLNDVNYEFDISNQIVGGNLTMICNLIGTKLHPVLENKILFLEDINEKGYEVHRHLMHMQNVGLFKKVKAVIFGDFTSSDEHIDSSINDFVARYLNHTPSYKSKEIGHGKKNHPIVIGGNATISDACLSIKSPFKLL